MNFELAKEATTQLGQPEYVIKEGSGIKFLLFLGGVGMGIWLPFSYFVLNINWVYGLFQTELPSIAIILLSIVVLFVGFYSLYSMRKKSELEICKFGLLVNDEKMLYSDITSIELKRGFFVKVIVHTATNQVVYTASKFSHKDQKAIDQVRLFVASN